MATSQDTNLHTVVALLQQDMTITKEAVASLINGQAKLNDIAANLAQMLAVHNEQIGAAEAWSKDVRNDLKDHMLATSKTFERLFQQLDTNSHELTQAMAQQFTKIDDRVSVLEKWKWLVMGGCLVAGALLGKLSFVSAFLSLI